MREQENCGDGAVLPDPDPVSWVAGWIAELDRAAEEERDEQQRREAEFAAEAAVVRKALALLGRRLAAARRRAPASVRVAKRDGLDHRAAVVE